MRPRKRPGKEKHDEEFRGLRPVMKESSDD